MKFQDLTGQRFGMLTVLERAENKGKTTQWRCVCDCGSETVVSASHLKTGHTSSCGCKTFKSGTPDDLSGKRVGMLTVLRKTRGEHRYDSFWECICDCGKTKEITDHQLRFESVKSCGCMRTKHDFPSDLTGMLFGRLTVIKKTKAVTWLCECECGNLTEVSSANLRDGVTRSCGCLQREVARNLKRTHGMSGTRFYTEWVDMKNRCYNENNVGYHIYGGAGITVCDRWKNSFENFYEDMHQGYRDDLTIDRIDPTKGYSKDNCRWATYAEQNRNKRNNRNITINGVTKVLTDWCDEFGISFGTVIGRIERGWDKEDWFLSVGVNRGNQFVRRRNGTVIWRERNHP